MVHMTTIEVRVFGHGGCVLGACGQDGLSMWIRGRSVRGGSGSFISVGGKGYG